MQPESQQPKSKKSRKGFRDHATSFSAYNTAQAVFDAKSTVTWDEIDATDKREHEFEPKINRLICDAIEGIKNYEYYTDQPEETKDNYLDPLFTLISFLGFDAFNIDEIRPLLNTWRHDRFTDVNARRYLARIGTALADIGQGRLQEFTKEEGKKRKQESNSRAKRAYQAKQRKHRKLLIQAIRAKANTLPPQIREDQKQFNRAVAEIASPLLKEAEASKDGSKRQAARKLKSSSVLKDPYTRLA